MGQLVQEFDFQTQDAPQIKGVGNAKWEPLPLASLPPSFDVSISGSFTNVISQSIGALADTFTGYASTLQTATQNLQNAACSLGSLVENLKKAQQLALDFASQNNDTKLYVRSIGLQPAGTISNQSQFMIEVKKAVLDVGQNMGKLPKIVPVEVPLEVNAIAEALTANDGGSIERFLEGTTIGALAIGNQLQSLSNNQELINGISSNNYEAQIKQIEKSGQLTRVYLEENPPFNINEALGEKVTISGSDVLSQNAGTFIVKEFKVIDFIDRTIMPYGSFIMVDNSNGKTQFTTTGKIIFRMGVALSTSSRIRNVLQKEKLLDKNSRKFLPVIDLVNILVKHQIIGTNKDLLERDKSIAIERISTLVAESSKRVGGLVLIGQAADLPMLAAKITALAQMMEYLKPVAESLTLQAIQELNRTSSSSGIVFDNSEIDLSKLDPNQNIGVQDSVALEQEVFKSAVLDFEMPELESLVIKEPQPPRNQINVWRKFTPVDLIPSLEVFGKVGKGISTAIGGASTAISSTTGTINQGERYFASATGELFAAANQDLASLVEKGQQEVETGINNLHGKMNGIKSIIETLNDTNEQISKMTNFLKNQLTKGKFKLDGHIIGAELDLLSNSDFIDAIELSIKDSTDPNRPTFGPPAAQGVYDSQQVMLAASGGQNRLSKQTRLWFGVLIFIIGENRQDLGRQLSSVVNILSMDDSTIDLSINKPKLSF